MFMKKSLLAVAAIAANSGAFAQAQVAVTGEVVMGYKASTTYAPSTIPGAYMNLIGQGMNGNPLGDASGLGVDTAELDFTIVEDLGGGTKITAKLGFDTVDRSTVLGGDTSLELLTPYGLLGLRSLKNPDYMSQQYANVGAPSLDNMVFGQRNYYDQLDYTIKVGNVFLSLAYDEQGGGQLPAAGVPLTSVGAPVTNCLGLGTGQQGACTYTGGALPTLVTLSGTYANGSLVANLQYISYNNQNYTSTGAGADSSYKNVIRTAGRYDLGVGKVGAAYTAATLSSGAAVTLAYLTGATSFGALDLAAGFGSASVSGTSGNLGTNATNGLVCSVDGTVAPTGACVVGLSGAGAFDGTRTGYSLGASYNLSKKTNVSLRYWNWLGAAGNANRNSQTELALTQNF